MRDRPYDQEKLKNLIHYVIWKVGARPNFGATKLYKIAWFSDARSFVLTGQSITGAPYLREKHGPIPKHGIGLRNQLARENRIKQWQNPGSSAWHFRSLEPPKPDWFSEDEKKQIDYWAVHIADNHTAKTISDESHDYGWEIAKLGETLPFYSVLADRVRDLSEDELEWAKIRAKELNLP